MSLSQYMDIINMGKEADYSMSILECDAYMRSNGSSIDEYCDCAFL